LLERNESLGIANAPKNPKVITIVIWNKIETSNVVSLGCINLAW